MWKWRYVHENYTVTLAICTVWWWSVVVTVVLCGGGGYIYKTPLAHVVVLPIATCAGGVSLPPTAADTRLMLGQLALCGGVF